MISRYEEAGDPGVKGIMNLLAKRATMTGFSIYDHLHRLPEWLPQMAELVRSGRVVYHQETWQGIESVPEAFVSMLAGGNVGKRVVQVGDDPTLAATAPGPRRRRLSDEPSASGSPCSRWRPQPSAGRADELWEEGGALYVSEADGRLVAGYPDRATAEAVARRLGGTVIDVAAAGRADLDTWRAWARPTPVGRLLVRPAWLPRGAASRLPRRDRRRSRSCVRARRPPVDPLGAGGPGGPPRGRRVGARCGLRLGGAFGGGHRPGRRFGDRHRHRPQRHRRDQGQRAAQRPV